MDEFFGGFDDDAFGETKAPKTAPKLTSYNAKICGAEWFFNDGVVGRMERREHDDAAAAEGRRDDDAAEGRRDDADRLMIRKYRGDRLYLQGKFG